MKAECYVGLDGKFVMTEKFPNTEDYSGLHVMLEDWINYHNVLIDVPLGQGFYKLEFDIEQPILFNPERDMSDTYLVLKSFERIENERYDEVFFQATKKIGW